LKDAKLCKGIPIGEGIESSAQQNVLFDAARNGPSQVIFGITATGNQKCTQRCRERPVRPQRSSLQLLRIRRAENTDSDRIIEDNWRVMNLVSRTSQRYAECGPRCNGLLHKINLHGLG